MSRHEYDRKRANTAQYLSDDLDLYTIIPLMKYQKMLLWHILLFLWYCIESSL